MPHLNLPWYFFGRPVKPVAFVLMGTMLVLGIVAVADFGILGASEWSDVLGGLAFAVAAIFFVAWGTKSQVVAEWALLGAFFTWGVRFWGIIFVQGAHAFSTEGFYLSIFWTLLAGGSWLLERADTTHSTSGGRPWIQR